MNSRSIKLLLLFLLAFSGYKAPLVAQDMEPRAFSNAPIGTNFIGLGYAYSEGEVSLDPSLPITNVEAKINQQLLGFSRFFALGDRTASFAILAPFYEGDISGDVMEVSRKVNRTGIGDMRFRFAMNLIGGEAMTPEEFSKRAPTTTLGISLGMIAPTGEYNSEKLINIGTNRWTFKPEIGVSHPVGNYFIEGSLGALIFTDNHNFFGGTEREQDPIGSVQLHAGYNFSPGLWLAADANYWEGGQSSINGDIKNDKQSSSRYGVTLSLPLSRQFSLKFAWSNGFRTRIGGNFDTFIGFLQYRWFDQATPK